MFIFADEAGDFKFTTGNNISRYFILCSVRMESCEAGHALLDLRRSMRKRGVLVGDMFHAASDTNAVRTEVFDLIKSFKFDVDSTLLEKPKAEPQTRIDEATFYKYAWFYHAKFLSSKVFPKSKDIFMCAAALETSKGKAAFRAAFNEAFQQTASHDGFVIDFPFAIADPCLQIADYFAWSVMRKWERKDEKFYEHIRPFVRSEFDLWRHGTKMYY